MPYDWKDCSYCNKVRYFARVYDQKRREESDRHRCLKTNFVNFTYQQNKSDGKLWGKISVQSIRYSSSCSNDYVFWISSKIISQTRFYYIFRREYKYDNSERLGNLKRNLKSCIWSKNWLSRTVSWLQLVEILDVIELLRHKYFC